MFFGTGGSKMNRRKFVVGSFWAILIGLFTGGTAFAARKGGGGKKPQAVPEVSIKFVVEYEGSVLESTQAHFDAMTQPFIGLGTKVTEIGGYERFDWLFTVNTDERIEVAASDVIVFPGDIIHWFSQAVI